MIAEIIINTTAKRLQQTFSYSVPPELQIHPGSRVLVPFGARHEEGIVVSLHENDEEPRAFTLKPILDILSLQAGFQEEMIQTALWISQYYLCNVSDALRLFMIEKKGLINQIRITAANTLPPLTAEEYAIIDYVRKRSSVEKKSLERKYGTTRINELVARGCFHTKTVLKNQIADKMEPWLYFSKDDTKGILINRKRQKALLAYIKTVGSAPVSDLIKAGYSREIIRQLGGTGLAEIKSKVSRTENMVSSLHSDTPWELTNEQLAAVQTIRKDTKGDTYVLHGVTGSGKTEVYMRLAESVLSQGKQVFVLVPEIALTGQIVRRFIRRFGDDVVIMHSQLSKGERQNNGLRMLNGESHICIGARSAIFTAAQCIGLIIIDEAHDTSYKQDESPRYHAVAVARKRAAYYGCPVILGSATPAISDYYKALQGDYVLVELKERVMHRPLPAVTVIDMRDELARGNYRVLSDAMVDLLKETLAAKQQAIILLNRRGFATFVMCRKCGYVVKCDTCDVAMVYHKNINHLKCHYCDAEKVVPEICPSCGSKYIKFFGTGTEKVEYQLHELFPESRIIRLDQDTANRKNSGDRIIEAFRRHEYDILLGTQMVAKGHDFSGVSAVGILSADSLLNLPAYWAGERTFQLLTQAAGRAGRGDIPGHVIMQTYAPDHYVIQCAKNQNYQEFYEKEIAFRKELMYPPFHHIIRFIITDENEEFMWKKGNEAGQALRQFVKNHHSTAEIIGPYVDIIKKIRNKYRISLLIKGTDLNDVKQFIRDEQSFWQIGIVIDVDPSF